MDSVFPAFFAFFLEDFYKFAQKRFLKFNTFFSSMKPFKSKPLKGTVNAVLSEPLPE